jgi:hypothetical protein
MRGFLPEDTVLAAGANPPYLPSTRPAPKANGEYEMTEAEHVALQAMLRQCQELSRAAKK